MRKKQQKWEETTPRGPPLCALCIGNDKYASSNFAPLNRCVRDAEGVAQQVNSKLGTKGGWATSEKDLIDKEAMESAIIGFLSHIRAHRRPPRMVMIYVSGHAVQEGDKIFLVPTRASPTSVEELRQQCLSHDDIFRILKSDLEDRYWPDQDVSSKICIIDIIFLVIFDTCRSKLLDGELAEDYSGTLLPDPAHRPNVSVLCASTSRNGESYINPAISSSYSAFTHFLISEEQNSGLFSLNTPVKRALENACQMLREHPQNRKQDPTPMGLDRIPDDFCLLREERPSTEYDICFCYRSDTDHDLAEFICKELRLQDRDLKVFGPSADRKAGMEEDQIARAIAHSRIVVLVDGFGQDFPRG